jgi:hypothetical protein
MISSVPYSKKHTISRETLQLHDFAENTDDFADHKIYPAIPATPLKVEKTPTADAVKADLHSGVESAYSAKTQPTPLKTDTFLARKMAELKGRYDAS